MLFESRFDIEAFALAYRIRPIERMRERSKDGF
jgi:hypothetical protein